MKIDKTLQDRDAIMAILNGKKIIRSNELQDIGVSRKALSSLEQEQKIERICRGVYVKAGEDSPWSHYWAVSNQCSSAVFCLYSALVIHGVTTQFAHSIWVELPRNTWKPKLDEISMEFVTATPWIHEIGIKTLKLDGVSVKVTSLERTVVDCFRLRRVVGMEVALEALKEVISGGLVQVSDLEAMAKKLNTYNIIKPYIEAII
ncbi:AbiEi antitoxin N-terminal domain-containing protein [Pseudomonas syringae pv. actinidiae]|nr:AbiEi antitoxin N-terminal domain-containing protein [Pseudomonas syringae pv. actinidiae]